MTHLFPTLDGTAALVARVPENCAASIGTFHGLPGSAIRIIKVPE